MLHIEVDTCKKCGKRIEWRGIGPHKREYCSDSCRQKAYRERQREHHHNVTVDTEAQARIIELERENNVQQRTIWELQMRASELVKENNALEKLIASLKEEDPELERELSEAHHLIDEYINRKRMPQEWRKQLQERFWQLGKAADHPPLSVSVPVPAGERAYRVFGLAASNELLEWASVALRNRDIVTS